MTGKTHRIGPSIIDTAKVFASEESCHIYLEAARWPNGVTCLKCGHSKVSKFTVKGQTRQYANGEIKPTPDRFMYQCLNAKCKYQFAATTGTLFSDTHLPLNKWMMAVALMCSAKKGISAKQMERHMGVSYKTAWYLNHRIRKAMHEGAGDLFTGIVRRSTRRTSAETSTSAASARNTINPQCSGFLNAAQKISRRVQRQSHQDR